MEKIFDESFSELAYSQLKSIFIKKCDHMSLIVNQSSIIQLNPIKRKYYMTLKWYSCKIHVMAIAGNEKEARNECAFKIMQKLIRRNKIPILVIIYCLPFMARIYLGHE